MLTCTQCNKDMYITCSNKDCECQKRVPEGELPMTYHMLTFNRIEVPYKLGSFLWKATWYLNVGAMLHDFLDKMYSKIYRRIKGEWRMLPYSWMWLRKIGITPYMYLFEVERCPYCGFDGSFSYWEDRNISQTFPDGDWDNPVD